MAAGRCASNGFPLTNHLDECRGNIEFSQFTMDRSVRGHEKGEEEDSKDLEALHGMIDLAAGWKYKLG